MASITSATSTATANTAMITADPVVFGLLMVVLGVVFVTERSQHGFWKKFYTFVPALLLCYFIPELFILGLIWISFHGGLMILVAWLIKAPVFYMAVGSQANIGGAASAARSCAWWWALSEDRNAGVLTAAAHRQQSYTPPSSTNLFQLIPTYFRLFPLILASR
jgi:vacuolar-type H+-ATPase subunit I/STV1